MYVCMCVCVYVCMCEMCMYVCICVCVYVWMHFCTCVCIHLCTRMYVCVYVHVCTYIYTYTYVRTYVRMNAWMCRSYRCIDLCQYVRMMHACMHVHMHACSMQDATWCSARMDTPTHAHTLDLYISWCDRDRKQLTSQHLSHVTYDTYERVKSHV